MQQAYNFERCLSGLLGVGRNSGENLCRDPWEPGWASRESSPKLDRVEMRRL